MAYPTYDYNRGSQLLAQLGSFWAEIFEDRDKIQSHLESSGHENQQSHLNFLEAVACVSRFDIPVFHEEVWSLLTFKQSEATTIPPIYKDDDLVYGPQPGTRPLRPAGFIQTYGGTDNPFYTQVPIPAGLSEAQFILQNKILSPSRVFINGVDYDFDHERNLLRFRSNLFTDPLVPKRTIYDSAGSIIDTQASIWLYRGKWDLDYIYMQFGYAIGLRMGSTGFYKGLLNAFWDAHTLGPGVREILTMLAACAGAPTILEATETVEVIRTEADRKLVITDQHVYELPSAATPIVAVGDELYAGDVVSDAVNLYELSGSNADYTVLPQLTIGKELMSGSYFSGLTFERSTVPLQYLGLDTDGKAVARFEVGGYPADVDAFFDSAQAAGKQSGNKTLAEMLDTRTSPAGQPTASELPATINPMSFALDNFFRNNLFVITAKLASFSEDAPGDGFFSLLREVLPPNITYILMVEISPDIDTMDLGTAVDAPDAFSVGTASDSLSAGTDMSVTAYYVSANCE